MSVYTQDEVLANFDALLRSMDFAQELHLLKIGAMRFFLRKRMKLQWTALMVGLWRLALERSFPEDWQVMLDAYIEQYAAQLHNPLKAQEFKDMVRGYVALAEQHKEADFTAVSTHLLNLVPHQEHLAARMRLRLSLHIRSLYNLIFARLV